VRPDFLGLAQLLRDRAAAAPQRVALVERRELTYAELWSLVHELAQTFVALGLRPGDRVAIALENSSAYVIAYYAALALGNVPVAVNPGSSSAELSRCIAHSGARILVARAENPALAATMATATGVTLLIAAREPSDVFRLGTSAILLRPPPGGAPIEHAAHPDALAALVYTSGTTAEPKAVMLSHQNLVANVESIVRSLGLHADERCLSALPFFHAYGASVLHTHLAVGATLVIEERFGYPARLLGRVAEQRVTSLPLVPSMLRLLLRGGPLGTVELPALRRITLAGGACRGHEVTMLRALVPEVEVFVMYGQTEATARLCCMPARDLAARAGSVGRAVFGVELAVRDGAGAPLPPGEIGEVFARGPNVMLGYYRDPQATAAALSDGWLRTGDAGSLDADGYLYLHGRRTDFIKSGGYRINPLEIEEVIGELEGVEDCAVVGSPDEVLGEAVTAYVQRSGTSVVSAELIARHCRERLSLHKLPRRIEFVSELPTTESGKVMRRSLPASEPPAAAAVAVLG
jgi:long-chain acyl-CoA synthetase